MRVIEFKGYDFESNNFTAFVPWNQGRAQWAVVPTLVARQGQTSVITGSAISARTIVAFVNYDGGGMFYDAFLEMLAELNPLDDTPGTLVMKMDDASEWSCEAVLSLPGGYTDDDSIDQLSLTWTTTDPLWHADTVETELGALEPVTITNPTFETNTTGWTKGSDPTNVSTTFSRDAAVYSDNAGSGKIVVNSNTAVGYTALYVMNDDKYECAPGDVIQVSASCRTTETWSSLVTVAVWPVIQYYTAADALISTVGPPVGLLGQDADTWVSYLAGDPLADAPATTDYCKIGVVINLGPTETGTVYFDDFEFVSAPAGSATPFTVDGFGPTHLTLTVTPDGDFPQEVYARTFTVTNNTDRAMENYPIRIDLGDNSAGDTTGAYWALLRDGKVQPCAISDYDTAQAFMWMVVDYLPAGESADFTLLLSDQTILPNTTFNSYTSPAFDIGHVYATTTTGSTSTVTAIPSGLGSEADRWIGGVMYVLSGAQAGTSIELTDSGTVTVTHAALGGGALASGVSVAIFMSSNDHWVYSVRQTERSDSKRGLWWISSGQKRPSDYRVDVPGSWAPYLNVDNNDIFSQKWTTPVDPGGGADYFAILDANRTWEGGPNLLEEGGYDGVSIVSPIPILTLKADYALKNPNSMCEFFVGSRQPGGALGFVTEYSDSSTNATLTNKSVQTITMETDTYQVYAGIRPRYGDEIGTLWAGDNGTATSASSTTLVDASKDGVWVADMYNGGWIAIISGLGAGQRVAITDTAANGTITVASWPGGTPDATSRYVITAKENVATVRCYLKWEMTFDDADLDISAVSAETPAFILYRDLLLAPDGGDTVQRVSINPTVTERYIILLADESLVIDGDTQRAYVADTNGDEIRAVPPMALAVHDVDADGSERIAAHWLRVKPGDYVITLANDEAGVACTIDVEWVEAVHG